MTVTEYQVPPLPEKDVVCPVCHREVRRFREVYADQGLDVYVCEIGHATNAATLLPIGIVNGSRIHLTPFPVASERGPL